MIPDKIVNNLRPRGPDTMGGMAWLITAAAGSSWTRRESSSVAGVAGPPPVGVDQPRVTLHR